jgi:hypothetical protein
MHKIRLLDEDTINKFDKCLYKDRIYRENLAKAMPLGRNKLRS